MTNNRNNLENRKTKWQIDLDNYFDVYSTFILDGHVDDIQPIIDEESNTIDYVSVSDYIMAKYDFNATNNKKCVVVYDPTECDDKRFYISGEYEEKIEIDEDTEERKVVREYSDSYAQHFFDILNEDELNKFMMEHNVGGPSLDVARIHYAVTENNRISDNEMLEKFKSFFNILRNNSSQYSGYVFVIKMTSRLLTREASNNGLGTDELMIFRQLLAISQNIENDPQHKLIILANKVTDLPMWFTDEISNPYVKKITIEKPSKENKEAFFDSLIAENVFSEEFTRKYHEAISEKPEYEENIKKKFAASTSDFTMKALHHYKKYLEQGNHIDNLDKISFSVTTFKAGSMKNPWEDEETVRGILNVSNTVKEYIQGQDQALDTVQKILTRAAIGIDRINNPNAPRVVLFLAGPTGTGKTEICKQIAKAIFGSEDRMIRFDMSEYGQEHADQKLFGAPPGYVGYEEGGKLTNAMKKEPFSLVLFDEIEKAHNSILDKFLQILGDGRLTDGKGETVSFTDAIIAITSNAGVTSPTPRDEYEAEEIAKKMGGDEKPAEVNMNIVIEMEESGINTDEIYNSVRNYLRYNVKYYFNCLLGRPELYGRVEDALVYYNYICSDAVDTISKNNIKKITKAAIEEFNLDDILVDESVYKKIADFCRQENVRSMGARGISKAVSKLYSGSLSNFLAKYVLGHDENNNHYSRSDLENKVLTCKVELDTNNYIQVEDIIWSVN